MLSFYFVSLICMDDMLEQLNIKQKEAVQADEKPLLIVAGAGSGKTKTLTTRIAYMIGKGIVKPSSVLALTFTNKAAAEMKKRIAEILSSQKIDASKLFAGTFHSFGAFVLRRFAQKQGRTPGFSIYDRDDSLKIAKAVCKDSSIAIKPAQLLSLLARAKNTVIYPEKYEEEFGEKAALLHAYEATLKKNNAFDFDDLIYKTLLLFEAHPSITAEYQRRFTHIFVDEYQDINRAQYVLLRALVGKKGSVSVVGDDAQSIYGFRHADFTTFLSFEKEWDSAQIIMLEQNYRSSQRIIEASSSLIEKNTLQKKKVLWTDNHEGEKIDVVEYPDAYSEADGIIEAAFSQMKEGKCVGILFRTNAQSRPLEHVLRSYGISYQLFGALSFYDRKEVKDVLAFLRVVSNPSDAVSLGRVESLFTQKQMEEYGSLFSRCSGSSPVNAVNTFLKETAYIERIARVHENIDERIENIQELIRFASEFDSIEAFLEQATLSDALQSGSDTTGKKSQFSGEEGIYLMTIHIAKGLEFDSVYVVGVNEGLLPHERSLFKGDDLEEERRLLYVAMTRARKTLSLSFYDFPSRFLYEIAPQHISFRGERDLDDEDRYIEYS